MKTKWFEKTLGWKKGRLGTLDSKGGGSGFLLVLFILIFAIGVYLTFLGIVKSQHRTAAGHFGETVAMELADEGMDQALSKIRSHDLVLPLDYPSTGTPTPSGVPVTLTLPVGVDSYSATAYAVVSWVMNKSPTPSPLRDIEGNLKYRVQAVVDQSKAVGTNNSLAIRRGVSSDFVVVNFGRYLGYIFSSDTKSVNEIDGPYHVNGNLAITSNTDWNDKNLCVNGGSATNAFYSDAYTTVASGTINVSGTVKSGSCSTVNSSGGSFNTLPTADRPSGTWIDGAHGGFVVQPPVIPTSLSSLAQVNIQSTLLSSAYVYYLQGMGIVGSGPQTLPGLSGGVTYNSMMNGSSRYNYAGISDYTSPANNLVRINLSALNHGYNNSKSTGDLTDYDQGDGLLGATDAQAEANYDAALTSTYGLLIYVQGNVAIWGLLPKDVDGGGSTLPGNTNKKVTIVATGDVEIVGDVAVSGSPYYTGAQIHSYSVDPNPLVNNPTNDAVAIISGGTRMFIDPWFAGSSSYFINQTTSYSNCGNSDMRIDAFLYCPNGQTGGANSTQNYLTGYTCSATGGCQTLNNFTFHGAVSVNTSNNLPSCGYYRYYDPNLTFNLSDVIPSGTVFNAYQDINDFTGLP